MLRYTIYALVFFLSTTKTFCADPSTELVDILERTKQSLNKTICHNTTMLGTYEAKYILNSAPVSGPIQGDTLYIGETYIISSVSDEKSYQDSDASAIAIANAINNSRAGVYASANPTVTDVSQFLSSANEQGIITINGIKTPLISITPDLITNVQNAIAAINPLEAQTGVVASANHEDMLVFTALDGRNITIMYDEGIANTDFGAVAAGTTRGTYRISFNSTSICIHGATEHAGLASEYHQHGTFEEPIITIETLHRLEEQVHKFKNDIEAIEKYLASRKDTFLKFGASFSLK